MSLQVYLAFVAACIALALVPGPVVTLVIANGLRHGTAAALTNIAGVQAGLAIVIGIVAIGLTSLMATMAGFVVLLSNPKVLVFFGAFIPQFMDMGKDHFSQVALLGSTFMVTGAITDSVYALLAGHARKFFSARRTRLLSRISGGFMIGGGVWLALTRAR
jgi:threonine/homoserine/homoserine lactone efflux protein